MSWIGGWKRQLDLFHLQLGFGEIPEEDGVANSAGVLPAGGPSGGGEAKKGGEKAGGGVSIPALKLDWREGENEEQLFLKFESLITMALPSPKDRVVLGFVPVEEAEAEQEVAEDEEGGGEEGEDAEELEDAGVDLREEKGGVRLVENGQEVTRVGEQDKVLLEIDAATSKLERDAEDGDERINGNDPVHELVVLSDSEDERTTQKVGQALQQDVEDEQREKRKGVGSHGRNGRRERVRVLMNIEAEREGLSSVIMTRTIAGGQGGDGMQMLMKLLGLCPLEDKTETVAAASSAAAAAAAAAGAHPSSPKAAGKPTAADSMPAPAAASANSDGRDAATAVTAASPATASSSPAAMAATPVAAPAAASAVATAATPPSVSDSPLRPNHWQTLKVLSLASCSLLVVPEEISQMPLLEKLLLDNNKLSFLPSHIGDLQHLRVLRADNNQIATVPVSLKECRCLSELSLENNRLVRPLLDFGIQRNLRILRLFGNPLEFLPEILHCHELHHLTLANVRIVSNESLTVVSVDISQVEQPASYFGTTKHKLSAFFALIGRHASVHHPLLASALARIAEDPENRAALARDESALRQIVSMVLSDNHHVIEQACHALSSLASDDSLISCLVKSDVIAALRGLLSSDKGPEILVAALRVVATLSLASNAVSTRLLTDDTIPTFTSLCNHPHTLVRTQALLALGNLSFCPLNRRLLLAQPGLNERLLQLAVGEKGGSRMPRATEVPTFFSVRKAAARLLAVLGENDFLHFATGTRRVGKRGVRILSMDGGGMRGMATVQMLRQLEQRTGRKIAELFDLICGTSTGGMLAVALGIKGWSLDQCDDIYKKLGKIVFTSNESTESASWREKLDQLYKSSSQNYRVVMHGSKHSAEDFERLLREMCADDDGDLLIDSAIRGGPKVFTLATLVSATPASPFLFRNYQYPPGTLETPVLSEQQSATSASAPTQQHSGPGTELLSSSLAGRRAGLKSFMGTCRLHQWQAIRASSAAPYYLDDFSVGDDKWQDGAILANNPTLFAVRESRLLWPDDPIDCIVSLGCGQTPVKARGKGGWQFANTGQVLIESASNVDRADEGVEAFLPMLPDLKYFRFNPIDDRCSMELDETDPAIWKKLEAATAEYLDRVNWKMIELCDYFRSMIIEEDEERSKKRSYTKMNGIGSQPSLGCRRQVLIVETRRSPTIDKPWLHYRSLASLLPTRIRSLKLDLHLCLSSDTAFPLTASYSATLSPFSSRNPSLPTSPRNGNPPGTPPSLNSGGSIIRSGSGLAGKELEGIPNLELDRQEAGEGSGMSDMERDVSFSNWSPNFKPKSAPPEGQKSQKGGITPYPPKGGQKVKPPLTGPSVDLMRRVEDMPGVGIMHLTLPCDDQGFILTWSSDLLALAEPSEAASAFLLEARDALAASTSSDTDKIADSIMASIEGMHHSDLPTSLAELVEATSSLVVGGILHQFMGCHTQLMPDGSEVGAYLFCRTIPAARITEVGVRWMAGAWRERIVICSSSKSPPPAIIEAILECGAKAVIAREAQPAASNSRPSAPSATPNAAATGSVKKTPNSSPKVVSSSPLDPFSSESRNDLWRTVVLNDTTFSLAVEKELPEAHFREQNLVGFFISLYEGLYTNAMVVTDAVDRAQQLHPEVGFVCHVRELPDGM